MEIGITEIEVPEMNDSISSISLLGTNYKIRFRYNDTADHWVFGLYTSLMEPIVQSMKIVPNVPVNVFYPTRAFPLGVFMAYSKQDKIGKDSFKNEEAVFMFSPLSQVLSK